MHDHYRRVCFKMMLWMMLFILPYILNNSQHFNILLKIFKISFLIVNLPAIRSACQLECGFCVAFMSKGIDLVHRFWLEPMKISVNRSLFGTFPVKMPAISQCSSTYGELGENCVQIQVLPKFCCKLRRLPPSHPRSFFSEKATLVAASFLWIKNSE